MNYAVNYLAVIVAAIAGIAVSALWYTVLWARPNRTARALDKQIAGVDPPASLLPFAMIGNLLAAFVLAVVLESSGNVNLANGLMAGALLGIGIALPVAAQIHLYGFRPRTFIPMDAGVWIVALVVMGAVIGAFG
jgi:hypothetical protein